MSKNAIHNFNLSIQNSADIKSSEELTKAILKELAKVSKEMSQQKDIVQEWQEQKNQNAITVTNNYNSLTEGGATDTIAETNNKTALSISNTPSGLGETTPVSNSLIKGAVVGTNGRTTMASNASNNTTSPILKAENNTLNFSNGIITQTYANVAAKQTLTVPQMLQTNNSEPTLQAIIEEIKKKIEAASIVNNIIEKEYWENISKAFEKGAKIQDFDGKPNHPLFTQMYAELKQVNQVITAQNFNWDIVRRKMVESIDHNILKGEISSNSKTRWELIKKQLNDDTINVANLFERYDELFLLLKEVEGLDNLPSTITIITRTKIYPNLSADKIYAEIGKENVYVFLKKINNKELAGSGVNKGTVKIKNTDANKFITGESLEFILDKALINDKKFKKKDINWIIYNTEKKDDKGIVFVNEGTSFSYNFDTPGKYNVEAYGDKPGSTSKENIKLAAFVKVEIIAQEIVITTPVNTKSEFTRPSTEERLFKIALKNPEVKTLNPLKLFYQIAYTNTRKVTTILEEQELDSAGIVKFAMSNLGEYSIKVTSKDQYGLSQKQSIKAIKNAVTSIDKIKDNAVNDVYLCSKSNQNATFKVQNFMIEPTPQEKQNVKWLIYDQKSNLYVPDGLKLEKENNDAEKPYLFKGESFTFPIPKKEGEFTVEAYNNTKEGLKSKSIRKICVKHPQVIEAYWTYNDGNKKKTSGFAGEINHIKATIPGYINQQVRIKFFLNDSKDVNYYNDTKTDGNGEVNKILKFDANLQKHFGIKNGKTAKIRFELEGIQNGNEPYTFKKAVNAYQGAILNVATGARITDIYFKYEGNRVTPFTKVPYGSKVTGVVRTLNMVGREVTLKIFKDAQNVKYSDKTIVNNEGVAAINFILNKKWQEINLLLGTMDMFYLGMEGIASKLSFENGLNAIPADIIVSENKTIAGNSSGNKYAIDIPYFLAKYQGNHEDNLKVLLNDMNEYYAAERIIPQKEQVAYMLATVFTETFKTFKPIMESFWIKNKEKRERSYHRYDPVLAGTEKRRKAAIANGNTREGDGVKYCGRGYVQITWKKNYQKIKDKFGIDVVNYPDKVMEPKLAAKIMIWGMNDGIFTGVSINRYINESKIDYVSARKVINGRDRNREIAADARDFVKDIKINGSQTANSIPLNPVVKANIPVVKVNKPVVKIKKIEEQIEEQVANSELDKVKLHFQGKTSKENSLSAKTKKILKEVGIKSKNYNIYISSTARSTYDQARIMYENCAKPGGVREQIGIYAAAGERVIAVYSKGVKAGDSKAEIIAAMENKIKAIGPSDVSKHIADFKVMNTFDVPYGRLANPNDFLAEVNKRKELDKVLVENDCYHIQINQ